MEAVIAIVAVLFVLFVAVGTYAAVKVIAATKAGVERTVTQARRAVEDTTLRAKRYTAPGAVGELAQLRLSLRASMRATQEVLQAGAGEDASLAETLELFERLSVHGRELDDELARLEREPERQAIERRLPDLRERVARVKHSADALRWAAQDRARQFADDELADLSRRIDLEAGALRHWTTEPAADAEGQWGSGSQRPDRERSAGTGGNRTSKPSNPEPGGEPQAITARDPRQEKTFPWHKTARPENTA